MPVTFRKAAASDIDAVTAIYDAIITEEEAGRAATGWKRGIYPVRATAETALTRGDLFVAEADGRVAAGRCSESDTGRCIRRCAVGV